MTSSEEPQDQHHDAAARQGPGCPPADASLLVRLHQRVHPTPASTARARTMGWTARCHATLCSPVTWLMADTMGDT